MKKAETLEAATKRLCMLYQAAWENTERKRTEDDEEEYRAAIGMEAGICASLNILGITEKEAKSQRMTPEEEDELTDLIRENLFYGKEEEDGRAVTLSMPDLPIQ